MALQFPKPGPLFDFHPVPRLPLSSILLSGLYFFPWLWSGSWNTTPGCRSVSPSTRTSRKLTTRIGRDLLTAINHAVMEDIVQRFLFSAEFFMPPTYIALRSASAQMHCFSIEFNSFIIRFQCENKNRAKSRHFSPLWGRVTAPRPSTYIIPFNLDICAGIVSAATLERRWCIHFQAPWSTLLKSSIQWSRIVSRRKLRDPSGKPVRWWWSGAKIYLALFSTFHAPGVDGGGHKFTAIESSMLKWASPAVFLWTTCDSVTDFAGWRDGLTGGKNMKGS